MADNRYELGRQVMTKQKLFIAVAVLGLSLLFPAVVGALDALRIDGSSGVKPLAKALGKAFVKSGGGIAVEVGKGLGTKARLVALEEGQIDIATASHGADPAALAKRGDDRAHNRQDRGGVRRQFRNLGGQSDRRANLRHLFRQGDELEDVRRIGTNDPATYTARLRSRCRDNAQGHSLHDESQNGHFGQGQQEVGSDGKRPGGDGPGR